RPHGLTSRGMATISIARLGPSRPRTAWRGTCVRLTGGIATSTARPRSAERRRSHEGPPAASLAISLEQTRRRGARETRPGETLPGAEGAQAVSGRGRRRDGALVREEVAREPARDVPGRRW